MSQNYGAERAASCNPLPSSASDAKMSDIMPILRSAQKMGDEYVL